MEIKLHKDNIAPYNAKYIGIFNEKDELVGKIELGSLKKKYDERLYRVGLLSDTHYNDFMPPYDGTVEYDTDECDPEKDLVNALDFMCNKESIDFVCIAGDISTNNIEHVESFKNKFETSKRTHNCDKFFLTCKGNHDQEATKKQNPESESGTFDEEWLKLTLPENKENITMFKSGDKTSFYYTKGDDVYIFFNVDYNNAGTGAGNPKLNGITEDGVEYQYYQYYNDDNIKELCVILNKFRNKRCFVFTHYFFSQKAGNPCYDYSYESSKDELDITHNKHNHIYNLSGFQFAILNEMNNHFKNSIWFSGHTHYKWNIQNYSERANVCNWDSLDNTYKVWNSNDNSIDYSILNKSVQDGDREEYKEEYKESAYNVHIPSTARPLKLTRITEKTYDIEKPGSEFGVMDVYENYVDIRGILGVDDSVETFEDYTDTKELTDLEMWCITKDPTRGSNNDELDVNTTEMGLIKEEDNGILKIKYTKPSQGVLFNWMETYPYVHVEYLKIINGKGEDVTEKYKNMDNPKIGFYVSETDKYSLSDCKADIRGDNSARGPHLSTSSTFENLEDFEGNGLTLEIKFSFNKMTTKYNYINNYLPYAHYRINVGGTNLKEIEEKTYNDFLKIAETHV